jgi:hypothetical protein
MYIRKQDLSDAVIGLDDFRGGGGDGRGVERGARGTTHVLGRSRVARPVVLKARRVEAVAACRGREGRCERGAAAVVARVLVV